MNSIFKILELLDGFNILDNFLDLVDECIEIECEKICKSSKCNCINYDEYINSIVSKCWKQAEKIIQLNMMK